MLKEFLIVYITGSRQSGKTTLTKSISPDYGLKYISFDDQNILQSAQNEPIGFINSYQHKKLILDEFQYIPELIPAIVNVYH